MHVRFFEIHIHDVGASEVEARSAVLLVAKTPDDLRYKIRVYFFEGIPVARLLGNQ